MEARFHDRSEGGQALARKLARYAHKPGVIVLALPRGGVPVAYEVARALDVPLDVFVVRKLGYPGHEELAMGALASGGVRVLNPQVVKHVPAAVLEVEIAHEREELERRERLYRGERPLLPLRGATVILVDDGLATGASMLAAVRAVKKHKPARVVVAVPISSTDTCRELSSEVDEIVCARTPEPFHAVGLWYDDFRQTSDREVEELLARAATDRAGARDTRPRGPGM